MERTLQEKVDYYLKLAKSMAASSSSATTEVEATPARPDNLSRVIHSKKDADDFMAALNGLTGRP